MKKFYKDSELEQMSFHDSSIWGFSFGGRGVERAFIRFGLTSIFLMEYI
ncbi:MAG: hypothetical protein J6P03_04220 [Opitutales bacterium]|nr:hypothetical protein [Opitutales bacterium]